MLVKNYEKVYSTLKKSKREKLNGSKQEGLEKYNIRESHSQWNTNAKLMSLSKLMNHEKNVT